MKKAAASRRLMLEFFARNAVDSRGERILFWVPGGYPGILQVEGALAAALRVRGVEVHAVLCDGAFAACVRREQADGIPLSKWANLCLGCRKATASVLEGIGIPYSWIGDYVPEDERIELAAESAGVTWGTLDSLDRDGLHVPRNIRSSIIRYLKGVPLEGNEEIVEPYAFSAMLCASAAGRAIDDFAPTSIFMSHAVYVDWGPMNSVAAKRGVPLTAWLPGFVQDRFYFRHVDDPVFSDLSQISDDAWREANAYPLSSAQDEALDSYIDARYRRGVALDPFADYSADLQALRERYGVQPDRPTWGIMGHVSWDNVTDYAPMIYADFEDWIVDTVGRAIANPDVNWLVKSHPWEGKTNPDTGLQRLIERTYADLPPHVRVIPFDEDLNPLAFYELIDGVVTVYGTGGLEVASMGKPVVLAGTAYYGSRGFTHDGVDIATYRDLLASVARIGPLTPEQTAVARRFAYTHFIRRQVPVPTIHNPGSAWWELKFGPQDYWWEFQVHQRGQLLPGADPFLDMICDRILDGRDFVMSEELVKRLND